MEGAQEQERHSVVDLVEFVLFSLCNLGPTVSHDIRFKDDWHHRIAADRLITGIMVLAIQEDGIVRGAALDKI